jgi:hypothetical protein
MDRVESPQTHDQAKAIDATAVPAIAPPGPSTAGGSEAGHGLTAVGGLGALSGA